MGIPKFFRYISERYPLTSQLIEENKIPEFDNLYVDFNGIIHNCSHPNDADAHFRLSEEQIFTSIFAYVDLLFGKIKPKKLFFMAVDGVAPRAKMNQQRSRRFRTAKEAKEVREKAERKGEKLPDEKAFDSNCITPGTVFMAKLSEQLKYFINKKISEDANWRDCRVVLSGHDVPGEGEHKIMEYIRKSRAQPDYNPNVRHCLYGLDADLIMLGLLSHDPHFCLLREEVKFGPARKKHSTSLEAINFYLLHLTLMREYLDLEFREIETLLPFDYSLERVIDDFILLAVFIGNDFLPHLPDVHIHENGLERLFDIYKSVLPSLDGYLNESGVINTKRLQVVLNHMDEWEREIFEREYSDLNWYKGKQRKYAKRAEKPGRAESQLAMTNSQRMIFDQVKTFVSENHSSFGMKTALLTMPNVFPARDRVFIATLAEELHLSITWDEYDEQDQNIVTWRFSSALEESLPPSDGANGDDDVESEDDSDEEDEEGREAVNRVLRKYEKAKVMSDDANDNFDIRDERRIKNKMDEWKRAYYWGKLSISYDDPEQMGNFIYRYIEGMQWVMHYYYSGVCSWGWFYDYHYAPRISDLTGVAEMSFDFDLGRPFRPFEQLMGVLPSASKELIPPPYRDLMYDINSPILDFYPLEFEQDLNGKKAEWEAVVKIPFIDEERLLKAMSTREHRLTEDEKHRNSFGTSIMFSYNPGEPTVYPSSLPGFFPALHRCQCLMEPFDLPTLDGLHLVQGLCDGVFLGAEALAGFPSLNTLPHAVTLGHHGVNIHGSESRNKSMIIHIENPHQEKKTEAIASEMIGQRAFVGWPFLQEGNITAVSDSLFKYEKMSVSPGAPLRVISNPHSPQGLGLWKMKAERIEHHYSKRCGVITSDIDVLVHVRPLKGLKRLESGAFVKDYEKPDRETEQAVQMVLTNVVSEDPRFVERKAPPLSEEFPPGSKVFFLGEHAYGVAAQVSSTTETALQVLLAFFPSEKDENDKFKEVVSNRTDARYYPSFEVAKMVGLSSKAVSKITSRFMAVTTEGHKTNLGLNLKFEAKGQKVIDYSRKNERYWEFSEKTINLIREYKEKFPEVMNQLERYGNDFVKVSEVFPGPDSDTRLRDVKNWLVAKGVRDFETVSLNCDKVGKATVRKIEELAGSLALNKSAIKKVMVNGIPRQAVLKPSHAVYRLQNQHFALGDRVVMVQDSGSVPLSIKGVVIGINQKTMDVVWDVSFMAGTTLGDRCSQYRGSSVEFNSCLNLSNPQSIVSTNPKAPPQQASSNGPFKPKIGPRPFVQPPPGQQPAAGFRAPNSRGNPVQIMANPNRGRGAYVNGRGGPPTYTPLQEPVSPVAREASSAARNDPGNEDDNLNAQTDGAQVWAHRSRGGSRGYFAPRGLGPRGGAFPNAFAGRGFRGGRGGPPPPGGARGGGYRGRGRGGPHLTAPQA